MLFFCPGRCPIADDPPHFHRTKQNLNKYAREIINLRFLDTLKAYSSSIGSVSFKYGKFTQKYIGLVKMRS